MSAEHYPEGGNWVIQFPRAGQIGPETKKQLRLKGFTRVRTIGIRNRYRKDFFNAEQMAQAERGAADICEKYNTGLPAYCKELLYDKGRVRHG